MTLINRVREGRTGSDEFYTPDYALCPLLPFLPEGCHIWEPCSGSGHMVETLRRYGYRVTATGDDGALDVLRGGLFDVECDCIVTNPPFSIKDKVLAKCYATGKPFALLLPLTALEGVARQRLYRQHGLQIILMDKRINFIPPTGKGSGAWFASAWFTSGLNLPSQILFAQVEKHG